MSATLSTAEAVEYLWQARQRGVYRPAALEGKLTLEEGYRAQLGLLARAVAAGERHVGWKLGVTSAAQRRARGVSEPSFGHLLARGQAASGAVFDTARLIRPMVEVEFCITLGGDLRGPGVTRTMVLEAAVAVAPALEIIERRGEALQDNALGVADNVSQYAFVRGAAIEPFPADLAFNGVGAEALKNGQPVLGVAERVVLDDPLDSIAWLANRLAAFGEGLKGGQEFMTGALFPPAPVAAGDVWQARIATLGEVAATFR